MSEAPIRDSDKDYVKRRDEWFYRGRIVSGKPSGELRRRAYQAKMRMRMQRAAAARLAGGSQAVSLSSGSWVPLGPTPLASDASGNHIQDYGMVAGRVTAVAIDPADQTGNTVYIGAAQGGVWKSTNAADSVANNVTWAPLTDNQATLAIGALAIQPGNSSLILAATGEANSSGDSYFGLGILRSIDAGKTWSLVSNANNGGLSLSGLGGTRMAFSTAHTNTVVSAMATSSEGLIDGKVTPGTKPGLYASLDAGQTWNYNSLTDPGGVTDATSATSVVYNAAANAGTGLFYAAVRYHGFYSSPDGTHWTRLSMQPGGNALSTAACPPQSTSNNRACPIYRGELAVVPGRIEMYAWYVFVDAYGITRDGGIWQSLNGGSQWTPISDAGITNCGDIDGCGVEQGTYNLELLAVPNCPDGQPTCPGDTTDLYAGAVNIFKCALNASNTKCSSQPFMNLTHAYGCIAPGTAARVHPDQHAIAAAIPSSGSDSGNELLYFVNDGGIYRLLNGFSRLNGTCAGLTEFNDLNQNLGSLAQFVSFSQHPTDAKTLLGGTQDNGSPATNTAGSSMSWINVLGGDGGYNAIDPHSTSNWYASSPDLPPGGLGIQLCTQGINCNNSTFNFVVTSAMLGGDDGAFYFPYLLEPGPTSAMLVGTCRVWRGPRTGGTFTALSPNFDTLGFGTCSGSEVNQVLALAGGGPSDDGGGSRVIWATTSGLGPMLTSSFRLPGGRVWVTADASVGPAEFTDVTDNGPQGSINPNQFPISGVATDPSDQSGKTAFVTIMGFTGAGGHVWKTTDAGATWTDFTSNLPDSPVNAIVVYPASPPALSQVYVGTDVGVFASSTTAANWAELGPKPDPTAAQSGFLPNVAVTALAVFASTDQQLLRASTYGRGIWQFDLVGTPGFQLSVPDPSLTIFPGQTATFSGTATALNGYTNSVTLSCIAGSSPPPRICAPSPTNLTLPSDSQFNVNAIEDVGEYNFNIQGVGSDLNQVTHELGLSLHVVDFAITAPSPSSVTVPRGTKSSSVTFQITAAGLFNQSVAVACSTTIPNASCNLTPGTSVTPTVGSPVDMTASVSVPASTPGGQYSVTLQATTLGAPATRMTSFTLNVAANPHFELTVPGSLEMKAGSIGTSIGIPVTSVDSFAGTVNLTCTSSFPSAGCDVSPNSVASYPTTVTVSVRGMSFSAGSYVVSVTGNSGSLVQTKQVTLNVGDYSISAPQTLHALPGSKASTSLTITPAYGYNGDINVTCDRKSLPAAICTITPANPITVASGATSTATVSINVPNDAKPGTYNINISSNDLDGMPSHPLSFDLIIAPDFVLTSSTTSQTVQAGQTSGAYNLTIQPVGSSFDSPVTLACTGGLPSGAQCQFSPSTPITPGNSAVNIVMSISTQTSRAFASSEPRIWFAFTAWLFLPGIVIAVFPRLIGSKGSKTYLSLALVFAAFSMFFLMSCSGVSSAASGGAAGGAGGGGGGSIATTYHVTITGSSAGTPSNSGHSTVVTLIVD